jgi:signal transduction histidine kinase
MAVIRDKSGNGFAKIARDLTAEHTAREETAKAKEELEVRVRERTKELALANAELRREAKEHARAEQQRLDLVRRIVGTQEQERKRISRELHDQLGQLLTALRLRLEKLQQPTNGGASMKEVEELMEGTKDLEKEIDFLAWELRPSMLDDFGLGPTLEHYVREWSQHSGIPATFHAQGLDGRRLTWLLETNLYRIAQEALNNAAKHSGANNVEILLEQRGQDIVLIVEDNGRGFTVGAAKDPADREIGLTGIRERATLMDGAVEIEAAEGKGTTVFVRIPSDFRHDGMLNE